MKSNVFCLSNHQDLKADQILTVKSLEPKGTLPINTLEIQPRQGNKTTDKSYAFKRLLTAACILKKTYHNTKNGISPYVCMMIKKRRGRFSAGTGFQLFWSLTVSKYEHVFTSWYVVPSSGCGRCPHMAKIAKFCPKIIRPFYIQGVPYVL